MASLIFFSEMDCVFGFITFDILRNYWKEGTGSNKDYVQCPRYVQRHGHMNDLDLIMKGIGYEKKLLQTNRTVYLNQFVIMIKNDRKCVCFNRLKKEDKRRRMKRVE